MFLHLAVILLGGGHVWQGDHAWGGGGMCGMGVSMAGETVTAADGTHHTGMHSCSFSFKN